MTGRVAIGSGASVAFESALERDWLIFLDYNPHVTAIREQPFTVSFRDDKHRARRYTPDCMAEVRESDGSMTITVYEVKYREDLLTNWKSLKPKFNAVRQYCRERGWKFRVVTERDVRTAYLENIKFLRSYRSREQDPVRAQELLRTIRVLGETTPQSLLAAAFWTLEDRAAAIPILWKMIAEEKILAVLNEPLTMSSPIWVDGD
jgi:hypothetical protein